MTPSVLLCMKAPLFIMHSRRSMFTLHYLGYTCICSLQYHTFITAFHCCRLEGTGKQGKPTAIGDMHTSVEIRASFADKTYRERSHVFGLSEPLQDDLTRLQYALLIHPDCHLWNPDGSYVFTYPDGTVKRYSGSSTLSETPPDAVIEGGLDDTSAKPKKRTKITREYIS